MERGSGNSQWVLKARSGDVCNVLGSGSGKGEEIDGKGWYVCVLGGWNMIECLLLCSLKNKGSSMMTCSVLVLLVAKDHFSPSGFQEGSLKIEEILGVTL